MLLAIDVGNTNIVAGLFSGKELKQFWRMETSLRKSADEYGMIINQLFAYEGLSTKDAAEKIGIGTNTLLSRKHYAAIHIRKRSTVHLYTLENRTRTNGFK